MRFVSTLLQGRLIKRYKRFLADVELDTGELITAHCPNTGSMKRCQQESARIWLSDSQNDKRKYRHTWELVEVDQEYMACINTGLPNKLVKEAIDNGIVQELQGYETHKAEVKYGEKSRIDWLLSNSSDGFDSQFCYVEVKNVTLLEEDGKGYFPDAVTERGRKHLYELINMVAEGHRAVLFFCVSHTGIEQISPAKHIDPKYSDALKEAILKGVEVIAYRADITAESIELSYKIPVIV